MKKTFTILFLLSAILLLINFTEKSDSINVASYILDVENPEIERKFLPHIIPLSTKSYFVCWEQGVKEINNNSIECRIYNDSFNTYKSVDFKKPNKELRYFPVDLVKIDSSFFLYFMEMDIKVYNDNGVSCLKRAQIFPDKQKIQIDPNPIWTSGLGIAMQLIVNDGQYLIPIYEREVQKDSSFISALKVHHLNRLGTEISHTSSVANEKAIKVYEPSVAIREKDTCLMIIRAHQKHHIHFSRSFDEGKNWSAIQESEINSPGSMSRIFQYNDYFFIVHNDIDDDENGSRNSLDLTVFKNSTIENYKTFNILYDSKDFFSNFSIHVEDSIAFVPHQRLIRADKYKSPPDRLDMVTFNLNEVIRKMD